MSKNAKKCPEILWFRGTFWIRKNSLQIFIDCLHEIVDIADWNIRFAVDCRALCLDDDFAVVKCDGDFGGLPAVVD